eukprot:m.309640 g.309640  ORF g.309640 m.309640 type:complete len:419 (+) comp47162_c0_seq1:142-1398(+)
MVEVVYKGILELQQKIGDPKSWKKHLFVLKRFRSSKTSSLEYYKDLKKMDIGKQNPRGVLNLHSNYKVESVGPLPNRADKFHFEVRTLEQVYRLATETRELMDEWIYFLQSQTFVEEAISPTARSFDVKPERTESLRRIGAIDMCRLYVDEEQICLANAANGTLLGRWPLKCLRRYGCDDGMFKFEAGRKAPLGEGRYNFKTKEDGLLFDTVEAMVKKRARTSVKGPSDGSRPPAELPPPLPDDPSGTENPYDRLQFETWVPGPSIDTQEVNQSGYARISSLPAHARLSDQPSFEEYSRLEVNQPVNQPVAMEEYSHLGAGIRGLSLDSSNPYAYAHTPGTQQPRPQPLPPRRNAPRVPPIAYDPVPPVSAYEASVPSGYEETAVPSSSHYEESAFPVLPQNNAKPLRDSSGYEEAKV